MIWRLITQSNHFLKKNGYVEQTSTAVKFFKALRPSSFRRSGNSPLNTCPSQLKNSCNNMIPQMVVSAEMKIFPRQTLIDSLLKHLSWVIDSQMIFYSI
jgi:hypothetical protein